MKASFYMRNRELVITSFMHQVSLTVFATNLSPYCLATPIKGNFSSNIQQPGSKTIKPSKPREHRIQKMLSV